MLLLDTTALENLHTAKGVQKYTWLFLSNKYHLM